jgi:hypothetical protein
MAVSDHCTYYDPDEALWRAVDRLQLSKSRHSLRVKQPVACLLECAATMNVHAELISYNIPDIQSFYYCFPHTNWVDIVTVSIHTAYSIRQTVEHKKHRIKIYCLRSKHILKTKSWFTSVNNLRICIQYNIVPFRETVPHRGEWIHDWSRTGMSSPYHKCSISCHTDLTPRCAACIICTHDIFLLDLLLWLTN